MIYDCFSFFNEFDLLELRLQLLNNVVDKFVLVEATRTYTGAEKPLFFNDNKKRYAPFLEKIVHIIVNDYTPVEDFLSKHPHTPSEASWAYENFQRHSIARGLAGLSDNDLIIVSDLDEIPTADAIRHAAARYTDGLVRRIQLSQRSYYMNFVNFSSPHWELGPMVLSYKAFRDLKTYDKIRQNDTSNHLVCPLPSTHFVRALRPDKIIRNGGWHFTFLGGIKSIQTKLKSFAHVEYSTEKFTDERRLRKVLAENGDLFGLNDRYYAEPPEKCLPAQIIRSLDKYRRYIFPTSPNYLRSVRWKKLKARVFWMLRSITPPTIKGAIFRLFFSDRNRR